MKYKINENRYTGIAHVLSFGCSAVTFMLCLWRYFKPGTTTHAHAMVNGFSTHLVFSILIYTLLIAVQIIFVVSTRIKSKLSFYMPACVFTAFSINMIISNHNTGSLWFVLFVLYGAAALYGGFYPFLSFVVFSQLVLLLIFKPLAFIFKLISTNYDIHLWFMVSTGAILFLILTRFSITRQRFGNQEHELSNKLLIKTPNSIVLVDTMMCVFTMSRPFRQMFRISNPRLAEGRPLSDLFPGEVKLLFAEMTKTGAYYETVQPLRIFDKDGYYKITCEKMEGKNAGYFINFVNLTTIMQAKIELERATKAKNLFLAKMSHEIRTPLNAITGMSELILREKTTPRVYEYANGVQNAGINLISIVNDILDFTKIESGNMEIVEKEYMFASLLEDIINIIRIRLIDKQILFITNVESRTPSCFAGDVVRIRQILINVLNNAVKYTPSGYIILNASYHHIDDNTLSLDFSVSDSGRGIKPEDIPKVFGEFVQIDIKENAGIEGTGLGLAISKNLCNAMGGEISLQSEYGKGSTFAISIPQKISDTRYIASVNEPEKKHVLVYEARELYADSISNSLSNLGVPHKVVSSFSALNQALLGAKSSYIDDADSLAGENEDAETWSFVFVVSIFYDSVNELVQGHKLNTMIVALAEVDDILGRNICSISMPVNTISIARVLNNETTGIHDANEQQKVDWIAPSAQVLVVDDINTNIIVTEGLLSPYKMRVSGTLSGQDAVSLVKQKQYDIIFLDHMMPGMDGIETAMALRKLPHFKNTPIIALTANAIHGAEEMFKKNGFDDLLVKPIEVSKLNAILEKWLPEVKRVYVEHSISKAASIVARTALLAKPSTYLPLPAPQPRTVQQDAEDDYFTRAQTPPSEAPVIHGIDSECGIKNSGGSLDFYMRVLTTYYDEGLGYTAKLEQAWNDNDHSRWVTYIHGIKSASANIGANEIAGKARLLEEAGRGNNREYIVHEYPVFAREFNSLLAAIDIELKKRHISKERNEYIDGLPNYPFLKEQLMNFNAAAADFDITAMEEILDTLAGHVWDKQNEDLLKQIQSCVLLGDYEAAKKHAEYIIEQIGE